MREPREGEVVTDASLVGSLRVAGQEGNDQVSLDNYGTFDGGDGTDRVVENQGTISNVEQVG